MIDISQVSDVTIQGAFGVLMKPTVQGLLGPDMLPAVLVPGMKDNIYSLCQILQPNLKTGASSKIAVFTENVAKVVDAFRSTYIPSYIYWSATRVCAPCLKAFFFMQMSSQWLHSQ